MCGINLVLDIKDIEVSTIMGMNKVLAHRGPDHSDCKKFKLEEKTGYIGSTRLKIMDISEKGNQPFCLNAGQYFLSFNGEIYNYPDLRNELMGKGVQFSTGSDTEVLMHMLVMFGEEAIHRLNGMFAFVFVDLSRSRIIIARDRFGIKPLYYFHDGNRLIISSEIKGVLASGMVKKKLNEDQVIHYLNFKYAKRPSTFFNDILEAEPGELMIFDKKGFRKRIYVKVRSDQKEVPAGEKELLNKVEELIADSLSNQLHSGVSSGLFLSGGVDSTLLLSIAKNTLGQRLQTFSLVNSSKEKTYGTEDYKYSKKAANQYDSSHYEYEITEAVFEIWEEFIQNMDQPVGDSGALMTFLLSGKSKPHATVILSGAGADEHFAGYNRHWAFYKYLKNYSFFVNNRGILKKTAGLLPTGMDHPWRKSFQLASRFFQKIDLEPYTTFKNFCSFSPTESNTKMVKKEADFISRHFEAALKKDQTSYLVSDVLAISDRATMAHNQEMRLPYLDNKLVSFLNQIPAEDKISKGKKWILKKLLARHGGESYTKRKKEGFGLPFGEWIRNDKNIHLLHLVQNKNSLIFNFISPEHWKKLVNDHLLRKADHTLQIWSVLVLAAWLEKEFGNN